MLWGNYTQRLNTNVKVVRLYGDSSVGESALDWLSECKSIIALLENIESKIRQNQVIRCGDFNVGPSYTEAQLLDKAILSSKLGELQQEHADQIKEFVKKLRSVEKTLAELNEKIKDRFSTVNAPNALSDTGKEGEKKSEEWQGLINAKAEAERIHQENLKYTPEIPEKTIYCGIVTDTIILEEQRPIPTNVEFAMRHRNYNEKIVRLRSDGSGDFAGAVRDKIQKVLDYYKDEFGDDFKHYTFKFAVACPGTTQVNAILESDLGKTLGVKAMAFELCREPAQVEGVMLALRVLHTNSIESLIALSKVLPVDHPERLGSIKTVEEFVRQIMFILPAVKAISCKETLELNHIIRENIKTAA